MLNCQKLNYILNIAVFCIIYTAIVKFLSAFSINSEFLFVPYVSYSVFDADSFFHIFTASDHSWYVLSALGVLLDRYIPAFFNIHPQEFVSLVSKTFVPCVFFIFLYSITDSFYKYYKNKNCYSFVLFTVFCTILILLYTSRFILACSNDCWIYAYIVLPIFPICLNNIFEKYYVNGEKPNFLIVFFLIFFTSISHEFFRFILLSSLLIGYFLNFLFIDRKIKIKHIFIYLGIIILNSITFFSTFYQGWLLVHVNNNFYSEIKSLMPIFFREYTKYFILENLVLYFVLAVLYVYIFYFEKNNDIKKRYFIYNGAILLSFFLFSVVMIIAVPNYDGAMLTIFEHCGIRFISKVLILLLILSALSLICSCSKLSCKQIIAVSSVILFLLFIKSVKLNISYTIQGFKIYTETIRRSLYIWEKSFLLLNKNSKSKEVLILNFPSGLEGFKSGNEGSLLFLLYTYNKKSVGFKEEIICTNQDDIQKCTNKMQQFVLNKTRYSFTEQELEKPDFQKLYEEEFKKN